MCAPRSACRLGGTGDRRAYRLGGAGDRRALFGVRHDGPLAALHRSDSGGRRADAEKGKVVSPAERMALLEFFYGVRLDDAHIFQVPNKISNNKILNREVSNGNYTSGKLSIAK